MENKEHNTKSKNTVPRRCQSLNRKISKQNVIEGNNYLGLVYQLVRNTELQQKTKGHKDGQAQTSWQRQCNNKGTLEKPV